MFKRGVSLPETLGALVLSGVAITAAITILTTRVELHDEANKHILTNYDLQSAAAQYTAAENGQDTLYDIILDTSSTSNKLFKLSKKSVEASKDYSNTRILLIDATTEKYHFPIYGQADSSSLSSMKSAFESAIDTYSNTASTKEYIFVYELIDNVYYYTIEEVY